jgi:hypothetical protein
MTQSGVVDQSEKVRRVLAELHELIDALDRRVPHLERESELGIAQEAALLRRKAENRIAEIEPPARSDD